jgi:hypothetical protein
MAAQCSACDHHTWANIGSALLTAFTRIALTVQVTHTEYQSLEIPRHGHT